MTCAGNRRSGDSLDVLLTAKKRKPNFTEGESLYLISQFERSAGVLTSKLNDASTNKKKVEIWKRVCSDYNRRNSVVLTHSKRPQEKMEKHGPCSKKRAVGI